MLTRVERIRSKATNAARELQVAGRLAEEAGLHAARDAAGLAEAAALKVVEAMKDVSNPKR